MKDAIIEWYKNNGFPHAAENVDEILWYRNQKELLNHLRSMNLKK